MWVQNLSYDKLPTWRHCRGKIGCLPFEIGIFKTHSPGFGFSRRGCYVSLGFCFLFLGTFHSGKSFQICFHDGCLWIDPWINTMDSSKGAIVFRVENWIKGEQKYENIKGESKEIVIPMPEGCYRATATEYRSTWWRTRWPGKKVREGYEIEIKGCIPFQGKGENSWDCGDDGLCGISCNGTLEEAIGKTVTSVLTSRRRYGECTSTRNKIIYA